MKENGKMTNVTVEVTNVSRMAIHIKVNMLMVKLTARASLLGLMVRFTMVNGSTESKKAMVFGEG
jgi:hypothetical protein